MTTTLTSRRPTDRRPTGTTSRRRTSPRDEAGAASAEYAAVTAAGVGLGGILIKLLTSDFGQSMLERLFDSFLSLVGIG